VPSSLDFVRVSIFVDTANVTVDVQFVPSTLDAQTAFVGIALDTDRNNSTGIPRPGEPLGVDYGLTLKPRTLQVDVSRANPAGCGGASGCFTPVGSAPLTVLPDRLRATVPLALIGGTAERFCFRAFSYGNVPGDATSDLDSVPDWGVLPACVE